MLCTYTLRTIAIFALVPTSWCERTGRVWPQFAER